MVVAGTGRSHALAALLCVILLAGLVPAGMSRAADGEKTVLGGLLSKALSTPASKVSIGAVDGALSSDSTIRDVTISDRDGVWLTARDLALDWSPLALVRKNVEIENLSAGSIRLDRLPRASTQTTETSSGGFSLPSITAALFRSPVSRA